MIALRARVARRPGAFKVIDAVVIAVLVSVAGLIALMALPRAREHARTASCQKNLGQIGLGLALFDELTGKLPSIDFPPAVDAKAESASRAPVAQLLDLLKLPDLTGLQENGPRPQPGGATPPGEQVMPGLVCPSDRAGIEAHHLGPNSYRACVGSDPEGTNGVFAFRRTRKLRTIQESDGVSYKIAFAERLLGDGSQTDSPANYELVGDDAAAAPAPSEANARIRGDAGGRWSIADYRYTLYNHAITPDAAHSWVASSGRKASLSASSYHDHHVHVLYCDGRVEALRSTIDQRVWKRLGALSLGPVTTP